MLLDEQLAPITKAVGFLELPLESAVQGMESWLRSLYDRVEREPVSGFPEMLHRLEPLTGGSRRRQLLVAAGRWTAYFDCALRGTDPFSPIGHLSQTLLCQGLTIRCTPHTIGVPGAVHGRSGAVQFQLLGPLKTQFLNHVRGIEAIYDGKWHFPVSGTQQAFEEPEAYSARRVRDRFTSAMLERYCQALGVDVFNPDDAK